METGESTHKLTIKTDLAMLFGTLQRSLQRARHMAAFGLIAADEITKQELQLPGAFFQMVPAANVALGFETARSEFKRWTLTGALRDSVESVHAFLDEARPVCFLYFVAGKPAVTGVDWDKGITKDTKRFHRLELPDKIKYLGKKYDPSLIPEFAEELITINLARNCLVHRNGIVSDDDSNCEEGLLMKWRRMEIVATGYGGERVVTAMADVEAGENVVLRHAKAQKLFRKGELLTFGADEFGELCLTLFFFGNQLVQNIERYGRSKGIHFDAPRRNVTGQSDT